MSTGQNGKAQGRQYESNDQAGSRQHASEPVRAEHDGAADGAEHEQGATARYGADSESANDGLELVSVASGIRPQAAAQSTPAEGQTRRDLPWQSPQP